MELRIWKNTSLRRSASALLAGLMAISLLPASAFAIESKDISPDMLDIIVSAEVKDDAFNFENEEDANRLEQAAASFPSSFDLRACDTNGDGVMENYVTPVKLQNPFGTCWGFGATAAAEISLLGSGLAQADGYGPMADQDNGIKELNLSEKHLTVFTFTAINDRNSPQNGEGMKFPEGSTTADKLNNGGWMFFATGRYASGMGPNLEDRSGLDAGDEDILVYHGKNSFVEYLKLSMENDGAYSILPDCYSDQDDWSLPEKYRFMASYRLKESFELPSPASMDEDTWEYVYNEAGTNAIKEQLLAKRGVAIAFHADTTMPGQATDNNGYISENWAHYTWDEGSANHAVCIVGWDDNYPKENFLEGHQPPADGAWIVKNSWGSATNSEFYNNGYRHWGVRNEDGQATGYFWLSYYDQSITAPEAFVFDKSNVGHSFYIEQHDFMPVGEVNEITVDTETGMANVFRADGDARLSELSFQTATPGATVTYAVFLLDESFEHPTKGTPVLTGSATYPYGGFHKVTLPESQQVDMKAGQLFSVAIKEETPSGKWCYVLPENMTGELAELFGGSSSVSVINPKESYFYTDNAWHDMSDTEFLDVMLGEGYTDVMTIDNFPIKAYLEPTGPVPDDDINPDPSLYCEPDFNGNLTMGLSCEDELTLYVNASTNISAYFDGKLGDISDPSQAITWTSSNPSVFSIAPINDTNENNDGKKKLTGVSLGTAKLTVDAGPYGKETVNVSVEKRKLEFAFLDNYEVAYTGQPIEPKVSYIFGSQMSDEDLPELEEGKDYKIEYMDNILCGTAQAIITGLGEYEGSVLNDELTSFVIVPAKAKITDITAEADKLTVQFVSQKESGISGYELSWCLVDEATEAVQTMDLAPDAVSAEINGLEPGKTYAVTLRAYVEVSVDPELSADGQDTEVEYGAMSVPAVASTCAKDSSCPITPFTDANPDAWYHDGIHWALDNGIMTGVSSTSFQPGGTATRAMVVTMLWRNAGEPDCESPASFTDVKSGSWYAEAVNWAAEYGIVTGYSDTVFGPNDNVTREQLATILYRYDNTGFGDEDISDMELEEILAAFAALLVGFLPSEEPVVLPFDDADSVSGWAQEAVQWAWSEGIINGKTETTLAPKDNATRAEVATILMRYSAAVVVNSIL